MSKLNFEDLPQKVNEIHEKIDKIENLIQSAISSSGDPDHVLNIDKAAKFLNLSQSALRAKISRKDIPYAKSGKRIFFLQSTLIDWLKSKTVITRYEAEELAFSHNAKRTIK